MLLILSLNKIKYFQYFSLQISNNTEFVECVIDNESELESELESESLQFFENFDVVSDDDEPVEPVQYTETNSQLVSMNSEHYKCIMQLIPEVERLKNIVAKMEQIIKSKDAIIKEQQKVHQYDQKMNINLSKLSTVITRIIFINFLKLLFSSTKSDLITGTT